MGIENAIAIPAEFPFHPWSGPKQKKLLLFFPLPCRFSLDIDETQFYTFINCNLRIAENRCNPSKGRIGKMATKKAAKKAPAKKAAKKAVKKAAKKK
jgi:hypothetical protein